LKKYGRILSLLSVKRSLKSTLSFLSFYLSFIYTLFPLNYFQRQDFSYVNTIISYVNSVFSYVSYLQSKNTWNIMPQVSFKYYLEKNKTGKSRFKFLHIKIVQASLTHG
jgi:hypothetical protein